MDGLRQMILSFCTACVMGAVIQGIVPEKAQKSGINLVLLLYILSTALHWQHSFQGSDFLRAADAAAQPRDYAPFAETFSRQQTEQQLQAALDAAFPGCTLTLQEDNTLILRAEDFSLAKEVLLTLGWQGEIREAQP